MPTAPASAAVDPLPDRLVFYDGDCGFCSHAVRAVLEADHDLRFHFAPLQGPTAAALRTRHPELPTDLDSMLYVEREGGDERVYVRADAVIRLCERLDAPAFRRFAWFRHLPRPLADLAYRVFARNRLRVSRRLGACPVPSPAERSRFLP